MVPISGVPEFVRKSGPVLGFTESRGEGDEVSGFIVNTPGPVGCGRFSHAYTQRLGCGIKVRVGYRLVQCVDLLPLLLNHNF